MLKEVAGDILLTKAEALAHVVAPNDNFANGLALARRDGGLQCIRISGIILRRLPPRPASCGC
jgi:O-acetyl-ADP-ribose deacetylase (regulator of RNase III)